MSVYDEVRRKDRQIEDEAWIREFLRVQPTGVLATVHGDQPYLNANLFAYDEAAHSIALHTARVGRTRDNLTQQARVCFTVMEMGRLLPADTALEFSVEYASVVIFGRGAAIEAPERKQHLLQLMLDKYAPHLRPGQHYRPITGEELVRTSVFEIAIESWTAKRKQAPPGFPGAFHYGDPDIFSQDHLSTEGDQS